MNNGDGNSPAILYFGNGWNADNRTSSHHIASCLSKHYQVHYIECPGMRSPSASKRDLWRILEKGVRFLRGTREAGQQLTVTTLLQIPFHRFAAVRRWNARIIRWAVRWLMWRQGVRRPILWFTVPHVPALVGALGESLSVYYCTDDHSALPNVDVDAIRMMDEEMTRSANIVFVASETLLAKKSAANEHTYHSPHGVDVDHFGRAQDPQGAPPSDVAALPHPVIGFFGLIEDWIDLDLVANLARKRPHWSFVMIGRVAVPPDRVPQLPNVHYLGPRPYELLPEYGRTFDAAIIPYKLTRQVLHANPLKLREFLAMGKPIVSVRTPETEKFSDVVGLADTAEEFTSLLDAAIAGDPPGATRRRMDRVACQSWESRVASLMRVVDDHSRRPAAGTVASGDEVDCPRETTQVELEESCTIRMS
jgi:glycosyltransferase involved in cell wall biosynthesis